MSRSRRCSYALLMNLVESWSSGRSVQEIMEQTNFQNAHVSQNFFVSVEASSTDALWAVPGP